MVLFLNELGPLQNFVCTIGFPLGNNDLSSTHVLRNAMHLMVTSANKKQA